MTRRAIAAELKSSGSAPVPTVNLWWRTFFQEERRRFMGSLALREIARVDESLVLTVSGTVDDATVESFERGLDRAAGSASSRFVVDLTDCQLESAGLAALIRLWRRTKGRYEATRLLVPDVDLHRLLELAGLTWQYPIYATMDAALYSSEAHPPRLWRLGAAASRPAPVAERVPGRAPLPLLR
jgi:anti-anti-sigma factor